MKSVRAHARNGLVAARCLLHFVSFNLGGPSSTPLSSSFLPGLSTRSYTSMLLWRCFAHSFLLITSLQGYCISFHLFQHLHSSFPGCWLRDLVQNTCSSFRSYSKRTSGVFLPSPTLHPSSFHAASFYHCCIVSSHFGWSKLSLNSSRQFH